jgi:hypothetical protein
MHTQPKMVSFDTTTSSGKPYLLPLGILTFKACAVTQGVQLGPSGTQAG